MKHLRIVLSLLLVVVIAMGGIFYVESVTTPIIQKRLEDQANAALYEMFGVDPENTGSYSVSDVTENYDADPQGTVSKVFEMRDSGELVGVIYQAETAGMNPGILFLVAIDTDTNESIAVNILAESETAGIGKDWLAEQSNLDKFANQSIEFLRDEGIDTSAGVTLTGNGMNAGMKKVMIYHGVNFLGEEAPVIETKEEIITRVTSEWLGGAGTDVTGDYEDNVLINTIKNSGETYVFEVIYVGFVTDNPSTFLMAVENGTITGFQSVETFETAGIGQTLVDNPEFAAQFVGKDVEAFMTDGGADFVSGSTASYTLDGINESILETLDVYQKQVLGVQDEEAPVITIDEARPTTFEVGTEAPNWDIYATATDNDEVTSLTNNGAEVDFSQAGTYTVTFTATDPAGNEATAELVVEVIEGAVEFELIPVSEDIQAVLAGMYTSEGFHDEGITTGSIQGIYTARDAEGNILQVFYNVASSNGSWASDNSIMVQFAPGSNSIVAINVFDKNATYHTDDYAPNGGKGEDLDSSVIAEVWTDVDGLGQIAETDIDSVAGTTAEESFPGMIESIEEVLQYQIDNSIGGAQ